jgi:hypothetical protein
VGLTSQSLGQELLVGHLVGSNDHQVVIERVHVSSIDKVLLSVVLKALLVESGLEMLKGQSVVENIS